MKQSKKVVARIIILILALFTVIPGTVSQKVYAEPGGSESNQAADASKDDSNKKEEKKEEDMTPEEREKKAEEDAYKMEIQSNGWKNWPKGPGTYGEAAIVMDAGTGSILYAKNIDEHEYPASITKVMTALVTLKNCSLDETVTVGEECQDIESGSSVCMIEPGDQLTVEQLLYGLLLNSGNDAAMSLAVYVGGTVDNFVNMMNEEAASLGATGTHFANPHGLHDEKHYTTAYDIYLMFQEALKYDAFQKIIGSSEYYSIFIRDNDKYGIMWQSTNYYHIGEATPPQDVEVIGGKTGTTDEAGSCLCLLAKDKYGDSHVSIILNAGDKETLYAEMNKLLSKINN